MNNMIATKYHHDMLCCTDTVKIYEVVKIWHIINQHLFIFRIQLRLYSKNSSLGCTSITNS